MRSRCRCCAAESPRPRPRQRIDPSGPVAECGVFCLAGADLPVDDRRILPALRREHFAADTVLRNDTFAVLRAGTDRGWGIGVVCGTGLNCAGMTPEGRSVRFPALGAISGDMLGGGGDLAVNAIGATIRARDGRGPRTELEQLIPAHFGLRTPSQVLEHVHTRRIAPWRVIELAPIVLRAADDGDAAAGALVVQLADELVSMVSAAVRRLRLARREFDLVLGGGIVRANSTVFSRRVSDQALESAPLARICTVQDPPGDRRGPAGPRQARRPFTRERAGGRDPAAIDIDHHGFYLRGLHVRRTQWRELCSNR